MKNITNVVFVGIDTSDHPDFCDTYIVSADDENGVPLSEDEIDLLNEDMDLISEELFKYLY